jgi:hypothetical protein
MNLGFTTEGKLAAVLIIRSSWGSQRGVIYTPSSNFFWRHCRGLKKKKLPRQLRTRTFSGAVAGEKKDFCKGSLSLPTFYFVIVLLYFIFACIVLSKIQKNLFL